MVKKNKGAAPAAKVNNTVEEAKVEVIDAEKLRKTVNGKPSVGLDANHQVDLLTGLKGYFKDDPSAVNVFGKDVTERVNKITAIGFISVLTNEVLFGKSDFAARMSVSQRNAVIELAPMVGVTIDEKLLPAPEKDGTAIITTNAVKVSKETEKLAKKEKKIVDSKPITDPSKIENEEQLKNALIYIFQDAKSEPRPAMRMQRATEFLRSYQTIAANKLEGDAKTSTLDTIKAKTISDLLDEVRQLVGECPFSAVGFAHFIYKTITETKNPVQSFCLLRNASKNKTTGQTLKDETLVAVIRVLTKWNVEPKLEKYVKAIEKAKRDFKDEKMFENYTKPIYENIEACRNIENVVLNPDLDFADNFIEKYTSGDSKAKLLAKTIVGTFHGIDGNSIDDREDKDELLKDVQQRIGIITNLFRDPLSQDIRYKDANLTYKPAKVTEKKEEPKNA